MGIRLPEMMVHAKQIMGRRSHSKQHRCNSYQNSVIRKGHFAVYVGDEEKSKRFVVPISYLKHPLFQALLSQAAEEFGFESPAGSTGLIVPCAEDEFIDLTSRINHSGYF